MTAFRSEVETLRARVEELEREKAELSEGISPSAPRFDPLRLFRRFAWFALSSTTWLDIDAREIWQVPRRWGAFCGAYLLVAGNVIWHFHANGWLIALFAAPPVGRVWMRYGMRLEDPDSRAKWEKRFE